MESLEIDMRERGLITSLANRVVYRQENLVIGDLLFVFPNEHRLCIERKTWCDLWSSIMDGRFREQRARLLEWSRACPAHHHVLYLIEGKPEDVGHTPGDTCLKTIHRLAIMYGFAVWRTASLEESADYVVWLAEQKTLFKTLDDTTAARIDDLSRTMAKTKKDVQTPRHYLLAFLQSVSGISAGMATVIAGDSASLEEFMIKCKKYEAIPLSPPPKRKTKKAVPTGAETFLADLSIAVADSTKTRKLGLERAKKILVSLGYRSSNSD